MKKILVTLFAVSLISFIGSMVNAAEVTDFEREIHKKAEPVLNALKKENNFSRNYSIVPVSNANKSFKSLTNGNIQFYSGALSVCDNDDLTAALLSMAIAKTEYGTYTKAMLKYCGTLFNITQLMKPWMRADVITTDLLGVDYMVKAGYNPIAMEAFVLRTSGDNSKWNEFWSNFPNSTHRAEYIHKYIQTKYPKYLTEQYTKYYKNLVFMPCFEKPNQDKLDKLSDKYAKRAEKQFNKK